MTVSKCAAGEIRYRRPDSLSARLESFGALAYDHQSRRLLTIAPRPVGEIVAGLSDAKTVAQISEELDAKGYRLSAKSIEAALKRLVATGICIEVSQSDT